MTTGAKPRPKTLANYPPLDQLTADTFFERAAHTGKGFSEQHFKLAVHGADFDHFHIHVLRAALIDRVPRERLMKEHRLSEEAVNGLVNMALKNFRIQLRAAGLELMDVVVPRYLYPLLERLEQCEIQLSLAGPD